MRFAVCLLLAVGAEGVDELLRDARAALKQGEAKKAEELADRALKLDANHAPAHLLRGLARETRKDYAAAVADYDRALALDPKFAEAYNQRGSARFKQGDVTGSLADFDKFLELRPREAPGHWMRGISCYYAGRFDEGRKQFEGYQTLDTNDVENAVWHFLCTARLVGVEKARASLLPVGHDRRVPLMTVYALFAGKATPADVMAAAQAGDRRLRDQQLFYAHLYLGLYSEATGDARQALEHLTKAAGDYPFPHYMGDVARVHRDLLRKQAEKKAR
jgi:lipoprotein NlpI